LQWKLFFSKTFASPAEDCDVSLTKASVS